MLQVRTKLLTHSRWSGLIQKPGKLRYLAVQRLHLCVLEMARHPYIFIHIFFQPIDQCVVLGDYFILLVVLGFKLRALHLLGKHSIT
jgi:hypothetical protein